jgi:putative tryptophan/tyrosine transport system substrate-binding protein
MRHHVAWHAWSTGEHGQAHSRIAQAAPKRPHTRVLRYAIIVAGLLASTAYASAQAGPPAQIGVILQGGPWYAMVDGLKAGLKELKLDDGQHFALVIRDARGDLNAVAEAARDFERANVRLIFTASTSVSVAAHRATATTAIVFGAGTDPVSVGLVQSLRLPGGRASGVHFWITEITGKRLELLREMIPTLKRVVTFYNPTNPSAVQSVKEGQRAAQSLGLELVERHVSTPEELRAALEALKLGDMDAYLAVADAMVDSNAGLIIEMAKTKKLPTMFYEESLTVAGGLASYSADFHEVGRLSARYVQQILSGAKVSEIPVERATALSFAINLKTAQQLGLAIPVSVLARANRLVD